MTLKRVYGLNTSSGLDHISYSPPPFKVDFFLEDQVQKPPKKRDSRAPGGYEPFPEGPKYPTTGYVGLYPRSYKCCALGRYLLFVYL